MQGKVRQGSGLYPGGIQGWGASSGSGSGSRTPGVRWHMVQHASAVDAATTVSGKMSAKRTREERGKGGGTLEPAAAGRLPHAACGW